MKRTLSAFVIAHNEASNLDRCLRSLAFCDEVVVVDSESTDGTPQIARTFTPHVSVRTFRDFADQKNHALSLTSSQWVLSVDADEVVPDALRDEIEKVLAAPTAAAYRLPRRSHIFGRAFRFTGTQSDAPIRLFERGKGIFEQAIHETVRVDGPVGRLRSRLEHYTYDSVSDYMERFNRYTTLEARWMAERGRKTSVADMMWRPPAMFIRLYLIGLGFRDGLQGFLFSVLSAAYVFVKHAKLWERCRR